MIRLYKYPHALPHIHDSIPEYRNSVPFSEDGIAKWCDLVEPQDAELFYCGQFIDEARGLLTADRFEYLKGNESKHVIDLEGDHSDSPIPLEFRDCLFTAMNATPDKRDWKLLVRPPCSMLLMDMVKHRREVPQNRKHGSCFIGKRDSAGQREKLFRWGMWNYWRWTEKWNAMSPVDSPEVRYYEREMNNWTHALCPPGEGESTVRYYEACGLGMMPIYLGTNLRFLDDIAPPSEISPREYFDDVIEYFTDPTLFFLDHFGLNKQVDHVEARRAGDYLGGASR
jgi:hypothetical protein